MKTKNQKKSEQELDQLANKINRNHQKVGEGMLAECREIAVIEKTLGSDQTCRIFGISSKDLKTARRIANGTCAPNGCRALDLMLCIATRGVIKSIQDLGKVK